jgi:uncharacterized membrane protein
MIAGSMWVMVGLVLFYKGSGLFQLAAQEQNTTQVVIFASLIAGLIVGLLKGFFVLSKTARKNKLRIQTLSAPVKIHHTFAKPFYGLIVGMMLLGFFLRTMNQYIGGYVVVAAIYCAVGLALIIGSRTYWQSEPNVATQENLSSSN